MIPFSYLMAASCQHFHLLCFFGCWKANWILLAKGKKIYLCLYLSTFTVKYKEVKTALRISLHYTFMDRDNWSSPRTSYFFPCIKRWKSTSLSVSGRSSPAIEAWSVTTGPQWIRAVCCWQTAWPVFGWDAGGM